MKRASILVVAFVLLVGGAACSKNEAKDVASDTAGAVKKGAEKAAEGAEDAADRMKDVVNDRNVEVDDFSFKPKERAIKIATEVTWVNDGSVAHTVTSDNNAFDSGQVEPDKEFSFRFTQKGTYAYHCENHPDRMKGTVVVTG